MLSVIFARNILLQSWDDNCLKMIYIHLSNLGQRRIVGRIIIQDPKHYLNALIRNKFEEF